MTTVAATASSSVAGILAATSEETGDFERIERPRSPRTIVDR